MKQHCDIAFEILHYLALDSTVMSVDYIMKNIDTDDYVILIVDNCSPDGSGEVLKEKYKDTDKVIVVCNSSNQGFTRGNNHGISYLRENFETDYIVVMNNDVMLIETALVHKLGKYMEEEN